MIRSIIAVLFFWVIITPVNAKPLEHTYNALQDINNNVYFATNDGLIRFDGYHYLNMSDLSSLPRAWTIHITYHKESNAIYVAYNDDGIWAINLHNMQASKVSDFSAKRLAVSKTTLFTINKFESAAIELKTLEHKHLTTEGVMLDVGANDSHGYILSSQSVYVVNNHGAEPIKENKSVKGRIIGTPTGAVFSSNNKLFVFNYANNEFVSRDVKDVSHIAFAPPHHLYYVDDGFIRQMSYILFADTGNNTSVAHNAYRDIFIDSQKRLWAVSMSGFEIISPSITLERYETVSLYNVISQHNSALWHGAKNGLYIKSQGEFKKITLLNDAIGKSFYVTSINAFGGGTVVSTNRGAFFLDKALTKVIRLYDKYVINGSVIDGVLHLSTDAHGVVTLGDINNVAEPHSLNDKLPSSEVLNVDSINGVTYISTAKGLVVDDAGDLKVHFKHSAPVSDVVAFESALYVATYGDGLFKHVDGAWVKLVSPDYITELTVFNRDLIALTKHGLHKLVGDETSLVNGTEDYAFIPNATTATFTTLMAASDKGLLKLSSLDSVSQGQDKVSYIKSSTGVVLGEPTMPLGLTDWVEIGLSDHNYGPKSDYEYQYRLDGKHWQYLATPMFRFDNISAGTHDIEFRKRVGNQPWSTSYKFSIEIDAPWYLSLWAKLAYSLLIVCIILFVIRSVMTWVRSFHQVFSANQRLIRKEGLRSAVANIEQGVALVSGNATMQTEGLVKLNQALNVLSPLAHDAAALGKNSLAEGLGLLQTQYITTNLSVEFAFDVTLGDVRLDHDFECEVYAVVYYAILSSLETTSCSKITVHVNKVKDRIAVSVLDDGEARTRFSRTINFGLGDYVISQIAKNFNTRCSRKSSRNGNKMSITLPVYIQRGADRRNQERVI